MEYEIYRKLNDSEKIKAHVIVIRPDNGNMEDLKILGNQLKEDYHSTNIAAVFVFDDKQAADLFRDTEPDYMASFYDNHFIASYNRNVNTKYHRFFIHLSKEEGGELEVFYPI
jgi:hypothetical protein